MIGARNALLSRRGFIAMGAAFALPIPPSSALAFAVIRNGVKIGEQRLRFARNGAALTVHNHVELRVLFLAVPVFHYTMAVTEHWSGNNFVSAASQVNDDGKRLNVTVRREPDGVVIERTGKPAYRASSDALPFTHWNKAVIGGPLINMETGNTDHPHVAELGWYRLPTLPTGSITARRYRLTGPVRLSDYYDERGIWAGLEFHHRGHIVYKKIV